jgi:uncharacterized protein (TIGR00251 family)
MMNSKSSSLSSIYLQCRVRPGINKLREGIIKVTDEAVELRVAAQPLEGEANRAVIKVISDILNVPKSNVEIVVGLKSRVKTVAIFGVDIGGDEEDSVAKIKQQLLASIRNRKSLDIKSSNA